MTKGESPTDRKSISLLQCLILLLFSVTVLYPTCDLLAGQPPKRVFILNSFNRGYSWTDDMLRGIDDAFAGSGLLIETSSMFMDMKRVPYSDDYFAHMSHLIKTGYGKIKFDAVLACDNDAFNFIRRYRDDLFPGVPVVFSSINDFEKQMLSGRKDITGTSENTDYSGTIEVALRLLPKTKTIIVVTDNTTTGLAHRSAVMKIESKFGSRTTFQYLNFSEMTLDEMAQRLSSLKEGSVVLLLQHFVDKTGASYSVQQSTPYLTNRSSVPCFVLSDIRVGLGAIGGRVVSGYSHGKVSAEMVATILKGKHVQEIPVMLDGPNQDIFDYKVLQRFNIPTALLPPGSVIRNRPVSFYETNKQAVWGSAAVVSILVIIIVLLAINITLRRKAIQNLRISERRLRESLDELIINEQIITSVEEGVVVYGHDLRYRVWNPYMEKLSGRRAADVLGRHPLEIFPFLQEQGVIERLERALRGELNEPLDFPYHLPEIGKSGWTSDLSSPLRNAGGEIVGVIATIKDITERKRMEDALVKGKQQYDRLVANVPVGVYTMRSTPGGMASFEYVSPRIGEIFNVNPQNFLEDVGTGFRPIHPDDLESLVQLNQDVFQHPRPFNWEGRAVINGLIRWLRISALPEKLAGDDLLWHGVVADITDHKQDSIALQESRAEAQAMLQAVPDMMFRMNRDGVFLDYKADVKDLYEQSASVIGRKNRDITPPEFADLIDRQIQMTLDTGAMQTFEYEMAIPNGGLHYYEARMVAIGHDEVFAIVRDVTSTKKAEEQNKNLQDRLQRSEKMEALGQLAGGVAHDLNNVLGVTMVSAELMLEILEPGTALRKHADRIYSSTEKAAAMIQDLLTLARRGVSVSEPLDLNRMVSNVLQSDEYKVLRGLNPSVDFKAEVYMESLPISGSQVHLEKTVFNLVSNAAESIPSGGTVTVRIERRYLDKPVQGYDEVKIGEYAVLIVKDTGRGIREDDLHRIFEPFYTKKKMGRNSGTGLGLAIVWGTVKDHNGYIDVKSKLGEGTTFTLYFPITKDKIANETVKIPVEQFMGHGESVLVVDDVEEQRQIAEEILTQLKYSVRMVSSGEDAVECLRANSVDIVILDMIMDPGMDGLDTYREILKLHPGQKAIIVSGFSETERVKEARRLGAGNYVRKPYNKEKIGVAIRQELERA